MEVEGWKPHAQNQRLHRPWSERRRSASASKHQRMIETCRLCLRTEQRMLPIFGRTEASRRIRTRILDCCPVQVKISFEQEGKLVEDAALPGQICEECESRLSTLHEFRERCRESELKLRRSYEIKFSGSALDRRVTRDVSVQTEPISTVSKQQEDPSAEEQEEVEEVSVEPRDEPGNESRVDPDDSTRKEERSEKPYLCDLCSKTFASKSGLRLHLKSHTGSKPHLCRFCDKGFAIPSYKKRHERIHEGDKRFVCHVCSAAFASSNGFKYHLRSHTGEANYKCETCGKCFARCKYLKEHLFTHTGERPFACKICGSAYANSGSLFVHEKKCKVRFDRPAEERTAKARST